MQRTGSRSEIARPSAASVAVIFRAAYCRESGCDSFARVGNDFNIGSTQAARLCVLFRELGLAALARRQDRRPTAPTLGSSRSSPPLHEVPGHSPRTGRQLSKLKSTYADAFGRRNRPRQRAPLPYVLRARRRGGPDGFSSNNPKTSKNIPIPPRRASASAGAFIAEPGHLLLSADYQFRSTEASPAMLADVP